MAASNPPVNGTAFICYVSLQDLATPGSMKANPTIAAGDFQISKDGGAFANLATLPTVTPAAGRAVKISLSAGEMTADSVVIQCVDQTSPKEWADLVFNVLPTA